MMPHEGVTEEESISLSVAWRGLSPYYLFRETVGAPTPGAARRMSEHRDRFYRLIEDPPVDCEDIAGFLWSEIRDTFMLLGDEAPDHERVLSRLRAFVSTPGRPEAG